MYSFQRWEFVRVPMNELEPQVGKPINGYTDLDQFRLGQGGAAHTRRES